LAAAKQWHSLDVGMVDECNGGWLRQWANPNSVDVLQNKRYGLTTGLRDFWSLQ
jgi:hypothetical protein